MTAAVCPTTTLSSLHCMMSDRLVTEMLEMEDPFYADAPWKNEAKEAQTEEEKYYTFFGRDPLPRSYATIPVAPQFQNNLSTPISRLVPDDISLDSWQRTHPEQWTSEDVLNLIYFIAMKSNDIEVSRLYGEKFQNVGGAQLCTMTEDDFVHRDPKYGKLLYDCIQTLLEKSQFLPPVELVKVEKEKCFTNIQTEIPITVEELEFEELFGIDYDIDRCTDFFSISSNDVTSAVASLSCMDGSHRRTEAAIIYEDRNLYSHSLSPRYQHLQQQQPYHQLDLSILANPMHKSGTTRQPAEQQISHDRVHGGTDDIQRSEGKGSSLIPNNRRVRGSKRRREKSLSSDGENYKSSSSSRSASQTPSSTSDIYNVQDIFSRTTLNGGKGKHLWEFLCHLLKMSEYSQAKDKIIQWESREEGVFRILDSSEVATSWGKFKGNKHMTYEKLSRALRWCRTFGFLAALPKDGKFPRKLCFRFGPRATNWRQFA